MPEETEVKATDPEEVAGQSEGASVEKPVDKEALEDVQAIGFFRRWLPSLITGGGLLVTIIASGVMFAARVATLETEVDALRTQGTPQGQGFAIRIAALESAFVNDRAEQQKDHELLLKIDRKLSLLICKNDRTKCSE